MNKIANQILTFFVIFAIFSCNKKKIDKSIVLQVDQVKITDYEYNRELNRYKQQSTNAEDKKKEFSKTCIDNLFFIADAYQAGYDTLSSVNTTVKNTADMMMIQTYGYLWQQNCSALIDDARKLTKEKLEKRNKIYYFDYVAIADTTLFNQSDLANKRISNKSEYDQLKSNGKKYPFLSTNYALFQWPFFLFKGYTDELYNMKSGEVFGPMYVREGVFYAYLDHIEDSKSSDENQGILQNELQFLKEKELDDLKTQEIVQKAKPIFFEENISKLIGFIQQGYGIESFNENLTLLKYKLNGLEKQLDVQALKQYLATMPFQQKIKNERALRETINQYYYDVYLINEAEELGLYKEEEFLLDQKNYKNKLILSSYLKDSVYSKINVDSTIIQNYYQQHAAEYLLGEVSFADIISFSSNNDATQALAKLNANVNNHIQNNYINLANVKNVANNVVVNLVMQANSNNVLKEIEKLGSNECYKQIINNGNAYSLIVKRKSQKNYQPTLAQMQNKIRQELSKKQLEKIQADKLNYLKSKYKLEVNKTGVVL